MRVYFSDDINFIKKNSIIVGFSEKSRIPLLKKNQLHPVKLVSQSRSRALLGAAMRSSSKRQNPFLRTLLEATLSASFFYNSKTFSFGGKISLTG